MTYEKLENLLFDLCDELMRTQKSERYHDSYVRANPELYQWYLDRKRGCSLKPSENVASWAKAAHDQVAKELAPLRQAMERDDQDRWWKNVLAPTERIESFSGVNRFLSNFYPIAINFDGHQYSSVEHAYVAAKSHDEAFRETVRATKNAGEAKRLGRLVTLRNDWEDVKIDVMYMLLCTKFSVATPAHESLLYKLLETGDKELVEGNTWGDTFWGVCNGFGQNQLGKLLMKIRENWKGFKCTP